MLNQRKDFGVSQDEIARILGLSRPTVVKIEKGERSLTQEEASKLNVFFESLSDDAGTMRINIPLKNIEKFKQVLLYILEQIGARPNVGMTVLYKLLYFIDFDYYEKHEEQLMGLTYFKNTYGPTPREFKMVVDEMINNHTLEAVRSSHFKHQQKKYLPLTKPDLSLLNGKELEMIKDVIGRYGNKSATELSHLSHLDTPWKMAKDKENLEYEYAFYRPDQFSVRDYGAL
jgi:DNA-binding XRE family transcriptional regulator/uncharacterized phage-associated protein